MTNPIEKLTEAELQEQFDAQLDYLKEHFGTKVITTLLAIPLLVQIVRELLSHGWKIRIKKRMSGIRGYYDSAYSHAKSKTIYLGYGLRKAPFFLLITIAHEYVHAIQHPTDWPVKGVTGRREFIEGCIEDEAMATMNETKVTQALLDLGYTFKQIDRRNKWAQNWYETAQLGLEALKTRLRTTIEGMDGLTYEEFYSGVYESHVPYRKRLP